MTFKSKNLLRTRKNLSLFKGMTLFFLWASIAVLASYAFEIDPGITNAVQYIQQIVLTDDGTSDWITGIVLNGDGDVVVNNELFVWTGPLVYPAWDETPLFLENTHNRGANMLQMKRKYQDQSTWWFAINSAWRFDLFRHTDYTGGIVPISILTGWNVGIGTNDPGESLEVVGNTQLNWDLHVYDESDGTNSAVLTMKNTTSNRLRQQTVRAGNNDSLNFNGWSGSWITWPVLSLTMDGTVGIGTDDPSNKLDVNGNIWLDSSLKFASGGFIYPIDTENNNASNLTIRAGNVSNGSPGNAYNWWNLTLKGGNVDNPNNYAEWWNVYIEWGIFSLGGIWYTGWSIFLNWWRNLDWANSYGNIVLANVGGNVGIGVANPIVELEIDGWLRLRKSWTDIVSDSICGNSLEWTILYATESGSTVWFLYYCRYDGASYIRERTQ